MKEPLRRIGIALLGALLFAVSPAQLSNADQEAQKLYSRLRANAGIPDSPIPTDLPTRLAGSAGEEEMRNFFRKQLEAFGLKAEPELPFTVTIPDPDSKATTSTGATLWPLWPNGVRTNTANVTGPVIDGVDGSLEALKGKTVEGAIVLMRIKSGSNWRNAAALGAKAVVFHGTDWTRIEAEAKFSSIPLNVPRFWSSTENPLPVGQTITIQCQQNWVDRTSANQAIVLKAPNSKGREVWLTVYADSMSVVPGQAPGAQSLASLLATLEAVRLIRSEPRKRDLRIWVLGAHGLALRGTRELIESQFGKPPPLVTYSLDFSTGNVALGAFGRGWMVDARNETSDPVRVASRILREHSNYMWDPMGLRHPRENLYDGVNQSDGRWWRNSIPGKFAADAEIFNQAQMNGLSLITIEDNRPRVDTPADTIEHLDREIVRTQAARLAAYLLRALNDPADVSELSNYKIPLQPRSPDRLALTGGFATVEGNPVFFDPNRSFVPNVPAERALVTLNGRHRTMMGVRGDLVQRIDPKTNRFTFVGLPPASTYAPNDRGPLMLGGYQLDEKSGDIIAAPSQGIFGAEDFSLRFLLTVSRRSSPLVLFKSKPIEIMGLVDPQDFRPMEEILVLDAATNGAPSAFGKLMPRNDLRLQTAVEDAAMIFLRPKQEFRLLAQEGFETRFVVTGPLSAEKVTRLGDFPYLSAKSIGALNEERLQQFESRRILAPALRRLHNEAQAELKLAEKAREERDWPAYAAHVQSAGGLALRVYPALLGTTNDLVNGVVFYLVLLLPFSVFLERLLFANRSLNVQVIATLTIFLISFGILRALHPAFSVVPNPWMVFIAFVMGSLSVMVTAFIAAKFEGGLRESRQAESGLREVDVQRGNLAMVAFGLGLGNLRRRKLRSGLTILTLIVMTFIVLSFTSIVPDVQLRETPTGDPAPYSGLMLRNPGMEPITDASMRGLQREFGTGAVIPRYTYFGTDFQPNAILAAWNGKKFVELRAVAGVDAAEQNLTRPQSALTSGRWFKPRERGAVLLPDNLFTELEKPKAITLVGSRYEVIGTYDAKKIGALRDLDGDGIFPPDFTLSRNEQSQSMSLTAAFRKYIRLDPASCAMLPAEDVRALGGDLRSLAVALPATRVEPALRDLMPRMRLNLYAGVPSPNSTLEVRRFSVQNASSTSGFGWILAQIALAALFVFNTMVAAVFERKREISIFSAIGLAPNHIALLFFAEALVMGVIGAVGGYLVAQIVAQAITVTGVLPSLYLNFSSTSAVLSAAIVLGVVLLSAIYPARLAKRIAAPAQNDDLGEPTGDEWEVILPFRVTQAEVDPLLNYLAEWLRAYEGYSIGHFVTQATTLDAGELATTAWLAPYDLGVSQRVRVVSMETSAEGVYELRMQLERVAGEPRNWTNLNRTFLADVRRQCLAWRA
jgi:hypothetical protein